MVRHSSTERIGIHKVALITESELNWIFRELGESDNGIDAQLEEVVDGKPKLRWFAVQVKTGPSYIKPLAKKNRFVYHVSNVHMEYWLGANVPVLLIVHNHESDQTYWVHFKKSLLKVKPSGNWKIEIPYNNIYGATAKEKLTKILNNEDIQDEIEEIVTKESLLELSELGVEKLNYATSKLRIITEYMTELRNGVIEAKDAILERKINNSLSKSDKKEIFQYLKNVMYSTSASFRTEIQSFARSFALAVRYSEEFIVKGYELTNDLKIIHEGVKHIYKVPDTFKKSISDFQLLIDSIESFVKSVPEFKTTGKTMLDSLRMIQNEYKDANVLIEKVLEKYEDIIQKVGE